MKNRRIVLWDEVDFGKRKKSRPQELDKLEAQKRGKARARRSLPLQPSAPVSPAPPDKKA